MKFKAYVLSPSTPNHGGYFVIRVPSLYKTADEASAFVSRQVATLRRGGIGIEEWWVVKDDD